MQTVLRRLRAALFVSVLWSLLAGGIGLLMGVVRIVSAVRRGPYAVPADVGQRWFEWPGVVLQSAASWAWGGAALGLVFAAVFAVAERGRDPRRLSAVRTALLGGAAALGLYAIGLSRLELARRSGWTVFLPEVSLAPLVLVSVLGRGAPSLEERKGRPRAPVP